MKPTPKVPEINQFLKTTFGVDLQKAIESDTCVPPPIGCGKPATEFRDELSRKEFSLSGLCQECQDSVFTEKNPHIKRGRNA